jgi:hypothetical protein
MNLIKLSAEETREYGYTHKAYVPYTDLTATAGTSKVITLLSSVPTGSIIADAAFYLKTAFVGTSVTNLTVAVGWTGTAGGLIATVELSTAGTAVLAGDGTGSAFATLRTGFAPQSATAVIATFTSTGANLTALTAGEVAIFVRVTDLSKI